MLKLKDIAVGAQMEIILYPNRPLSLEKINNQIKFVVATHLPKGKAFKQNQVTHIAGMLMENNTKERYIVVMGSTTAGLGISRSLTGRGTTVTAPAKIPYNYVKRAFILGTFTTTRPDWLEDKLVDSAGTQKRQVIP